MIDAKTFWDKAAAKYARDPIRDMAAYEYTLERTRSYLTGQDNVLELGCGTGSTALLLARSAGHITATDVSAKMIEIARHKSAAEGIKNITFDEANVTGAITGRYDTVLAFNLLHLVPDMEQAIAAVHAALAQGGHFISKSPCLGQRGAGIKGLAIRMAIPLMQAVGKAPYVRAFSIRNLEQAMLQAGFEIIESGNFPAGSPPARYIVARKR